MSNPLHDRLEQVYAEHPLTATSVLNRALREYGVHVPLTERHLAETTIGGPTDQNHAGGVRTVRELARELNVRPGWRVLDIGSGLGGPVRVLAEEYACSCHGVELTKSRFLGAVQLTHLVGMTESVSFSQGDFMDVALPEDTFDLAIAQGAMMHFNDLRGVLRRTHCLLRSSGIVVIEEGLLLREPIDANELETLNTLQSYWNGRFHPEDYWQRVLTECKFSTISSRDLTEIAAEEFELLMKTDSGGGYGRITKEERLGWELGKCLFDTGLLGMFRFTCRKMEPTMQPSARR